MHTSAERSKRNMRIILASLAFLTFWGFCTTAYYWSQSMGMRTGLNDGKLANERLLAEKLQLEKQVFELNGRLDREKEALAGSESEVADLRRRVEEAISRSKGLEGAARKSKSLAGEVADLKAQKQQLEVLLAATNSNERDLQEQLNRMTLERDGLAAKLEEHKAGAWMVNNAEVDAIRGKKGKLTVIARRAKEIRMAFDLPQDLAPGVTFQVITPEGRSYTGGSPTISMSIDEAEPEPMASIDLMPEEVVGERASRVHLKFTPTEKLRPGTYRIDVMAGGGHLNTVLLNLR